ncbi:EAL domain-containing protein [Pseudoxanthomonas sp. F37]|jgi:EAL domain-containing protein (putative c-di-GMP-specific phosphodiesterase class I)/PleD family two-component response regulator|uniref:EAL domain-containing protein n=1 Tax=Pseudoxanthomonas TaxID=83618 RepID=UPI001FD53D13|nr:MULTISPECIES: EAL domain-containing response regulator [Pseudoxanthomonas]UOV04254.1 EAL domain-containing protein [Pseudoxanthomonas mexicana]UOV09249.1 EAL domain-containing protein [Pseudoxanthomonas sp. F37]
MSVLDSTSRPQDEPSRSRLRAETPPAHHWRRWVGDATPEDLEQAPDAGDSPTMNPLPQPPVDTAPATPPPEAPAASAANRVPEPVDPESPYRVLIVEDDRGQALFAQSVLHGAGMQAEVQMQSDGLLDAMRRFRPDLVLMDLHMPGKDGMSLTMLLRQQPEYLHLPIVFLTGDPDPERQFEVLESGADDFLNKPIRPRHLIAAVSNRIQRARQRNQALQAPRPSVNSDTGLPTRTFVLQHLADSLQRQSRGGLFFVEVNSALSLRERYGYAVFEHLMNQAGRQLAAAASPHPVARLNDNSFLMLADGVDEATLPALAQQLRDGLGSHDFQTRANEVLKLRSSVGYTALSLGFADAGSALEAIERAVLQARLKPDSVAEYVPAEIDDDAPRISLEDGQFELAYQPIVAVAGSEQAQYQVLLRMRQPDGSLLPASQVIPAAELAGGIAQIDHWVLEHALYVLAERQAQGPSLRLFVSQSPRSLARESHAQWLLDALRARGIEGTSLVIDLRLADALIHTVTLRQFCQQLMPAGVQFCLSQFEPGAEADALLTQLPLGFVRVSSKYASAHADMQLRDQLRGIIDNAHRQGLQVIGQQIEDPQAAAAMWMGGVDFIQGNLVQAVGSELGFDFHNAVL